MQLQDFRSKLQVGGVSAVNHTLSGLLVFTRGGQQRWHSVVKCGRIFGSTQAMLEEEIGDDKGVVKVLLARCCSRGSS